MKMQSNVAAARLLAAPLGCYMHWQLFVKYQIPYFVWVQKWIRYYSNLQASLGLSLITTWNGIINATD